MEDILNIPLFDDDFYKMTFRFIMNIGFLALIINWLYYAKTKRRDYLFTYYMIGIIVFFLCFTLKKYELDIGMALGLVCHIRHHSLPNRRHRHQRDDLSCL